MQKVFWTQGAKVSQEFLTPCATLFRTGATPGCAGARGFRSLGSKDLLHPLLNTFGDFPFFRPLSQVLWSAKLCPPYEQRHFYANKAKTEMRFIYPYRATLRYYRCDTPHIAGCFFREVSTPPIWCDTPPPLYLVSHRHICAIPHFATYRVIIVRSPPPPTKTSTKEFCDTIATSIARYEEYRCWASEEMRHFCLKHYKTRCTLAKRDRIKNPRHGQHPERDQNEMRICII